MQAAPWFYNFISLGGVAVILLLARLSGLGRGPARWTTVAWGLGLQFTLAAVFFFLPWGKGFFLMINDVVLALIQASRAGIAFLFGPLAVGPGQTGPDGQPSLGFILAIQGLPTVIFFMALSALLYQLGVMQRVVRIFSRLFVKTLGSSGAESLGVASNIFVGVESAGMVRPFLPTMTRSEFFCLLTAAMSTVASTTLGIYVATLHHIFPNIAGHLISASLMSAPAAVVVAKLMEPETGQPLTAGRVVDPEIGRYEGLMEAINRGSLDGARLLVGICALLASYLGLAALAQIILGWLGGLVGLPGLELKSLLGYAAWPLTLAMGVPPVDALAVARLLGERLLVTEIPAYADLAQLLAQHGLVYSRSVLVASYALCGFTHVGSVAIFVGGFGALAPERLGELSRLGFKALWAATLTTVMTGCVAGIFASGGSLLLGN
ncbi:MAG: nucleoside transporter [Deltaproteobacteria bacterium]|nr:nucleoside transporter [Deltaproteobacteria bacterium]